jgi:hypothetical protein
VVRTRDKKGYLFFGSDGGNHPFEGHLTSRAGSITVSAGTLDHSLGLPPGDPNPAPSEFLVPKSHNLPATMDYVGGGPVYRVPEGEPGAGNLLIVYHTERPANPFWSWLGLAKSADEGSTWQDLGLIISGPQPYTAQGALDIGDGNLVIAIDPTTSQKYFYIFFPEHCWINSTQFCSGFTHLSVARASYEELLKTAFMDGTTASKSFHNIMTASGISQASEERPASCFRPSPGRPTEIRRWYGVHIEIDLSRSWTMRNILLTASPGTDSTGLRCR